MKTMQKPKLRLKLLSQGITPLSEGTTPSNEAISLTRNDISVEEL